MRFAFLVLALVSAMVSHAAENPVVGPDRLQIVVSADVPSTQAALSIMEVAYRRLGIRLDTLEVPSRRALFLANQGRVDGDLFRTRSVGEERENLIRVPSPLLHGRLMAVFPDDIEGDPGFSGKTVAVRRGVLIAERTAKRLNMQLARTGNYGQSLNLLKYRRVDMALISHVEGGSPLSDSQWAQFHIHPEPVVRFTLFHYLHRRHADLVAPLGAIMERMALTGERARILQSQAGK